MDGLKLFEHRGLFDTLISHGLLTLAPFVLAQYNEKQTQKYLSTTLSAESILPSALVKTTLSPE